MLEHVPHWLGAMLQGVRAGGAKLSIAQGLLEPLGETIDLSSPAFANGARLPERFTADGEGVSPPLIWGPVPAATQGFALIVEDPDAPALQPFVHAVVWGLPADARSLHEGAITRDGRGSAAGADVGRNSYFAEGWLPPDPPNGHGSHDYVFQLFALSEVPAVGVNPGRSEVIEAIAGKVIGAGMLVGTYSRGEYRPIDRPIMGAAPG